MIQMKIVCRLFARNAQFSLDKKLSYGDDVISSCNLRSFVTEKFFLNNIITNEIIMLTYT